MNPSHAIMKLSIIQTDGCIFKIFCGLFSLLFSLGGTWCISVQYACETAAAEKPHWHLCCLEGIQTVVFVHIHNKSVYMWQWMIQYLEISL